MNELIERYVGKECIIYTLNSQVSGTVLELKDGWLSLRSSDDADLINLDYIIRIREYPRSKKGKKSVVID